LFDALVRGESPHSAARKFVTKTRVLAVAHIEDFSDPKLRRFDTIQQCDRQTDGRTDGRLCRSKDALSITCCRG